MLLFCPCKHSTPNDHGGSFYHNHEWKKLNLQYSRIIVSTFVENWFSIDFLFISEKKFTLLKFWPHHNHWDHKLSELVCTLLEDYSTKVSGKICFKNDFFFMTWGDNEHCLISKVQKENTKKEHSKHKIYEYMWNPLRLKIMIWKTLDCKYHFVHISSSFLY